MTELELTTLLDKLLFLHPALDGKIYYSHSDWIIYDMTISDSKLLDSVLATLALSGITATLEDAGLKGFNLVDGTYLYEYLSLVDDDLELNIIKSDKPHIAVCTTYISRNIR